MSRPLRVEFPDAIYHVTSRGSERGAIVADDHDRERWLLGLQRAAEGHRWRIFAFALMNNHFHLFLQTPEPNLSAGMHDLNTAYVNYYNARHERAGHLLQGRFKAVLVEDEGHWTEMSRYVHLNPVRAGLVKRPEDWRWSSYAGYHRPAKGLAWVHYPRVLDEFGGDTPSGRRRYREFVAAGLGRPLDSPLALAWHGLVLGSDRFLARIRGMLEARPDHPEVPGLTRLRGRPSLSCVIAEVARRSGSDPSRWAPRRRCDEPARALAAYLARRVAGIPSPQIAEALGYRSISSVSVACRRIEGAPRNSPVRRALLDLMSRLAVSP